MEIYNRIYQKIRTNRRARNTEEGLRKTDAAIQALMTQRFIFGN